MMIDANDYDCPLKYDQEKDSTNAIRWFFS